MFTAPFKILCQSLRAAKVLQEPGWLQPGRLASPAAQQLCLKSNKCGKKGKKKGGGGGGGGCGGCGPKCEPTPPASKECPSICPPKERVQPCSNKEHKCRKPKCFEKDKVPPCYPEKPKRPKQKKCKDMHTLAGTPGLLSVVRPFATFSSLPGPSTGSGLESAVRGFHTASAPLMSYKSPIQPCKNPPPGAGSMCCVKEKKDKNDKNKCKKVCMPGCKPALHKRCMKKRMRKFERCCRILPPYPCFSECIREPLRKDRFSECNCNEPQSVCCQDQRKRRKRPPPFKCGCK